MENREKMCPLSLHFDKEQDEHRACDCQKEECAWYDAKYGRCAVLSQACKK